MKKKYVFLAIILPLISSSIIFAQDLTSTNLRIQDLSFGAIENSTQSSNFRLNIDSSEFINRSDINSSLYNLGIGTGNTWEAYVPKISCFETISTITSCSDIRWANGSEFICGNGGCTDKARFEIDDQDNPIDTLYSIQISTDVNFNVIQYLDGTTRTLETVFTHTIDDYLTKTAWESSSPATNILGLEPDTQYYIRATALKGDFTESPDGPALTARTGINSIILDLDIDLETNPTAETSAPYQIDLADILVSTVTSAASNIWIDFGTNISSGAKINLSGVNQGLLSSSTSSTVDSFTGDLSANTGFGIRNTSLNQAALGPLALNPIFSGVGDNVGGYTNDFIDTNIIITNLPLYNGRASFEVKARPAEDDIAAEDYSETLTFTVIGDI